MLHAAGVIASLCAASLVLPGCAAPSQNVETMGVYGLASQRLSGAQSATVKGASGFTEVEVLVTVGVDGRVIKAELDDNLYKQDPGPALATAKGWTFRPQYFEGRPIQALGDIRIVYDPPTIPVDEFVPFPDGAPEDTEIVLERSACYGSCPDYRASVSGNGRVRFSTREQHFPGTAAEIFRAHEGLGVLWPGSHEARIDPREVAALVARFRAAHFMGLKSEYFYGATDAPTYALTLRVGRTTKRVIDYIGSEAGMPRSVTALEDAVDSLAETQRWVHGNAGTVALLKAEGFDFRSKSAAEMVAYAIELNRWPKSQSGANELIRAAMAAGLDPSLPVNVGSRQAKPDTVPIGTLIAGYAAETGDEKLFDDMARLGPVGRMNKRELDAAFVTAMGCSAKIARALIAAGASPKASGDGGNALHAVRDSNGDCADAPKERRLEMARALVALGVPLEARDSLGWTPLMACDDPELVPVLLKAGANPNAHSPKGTTPLLSIDDDRVAILLLRAGADPRAKDHNGTVLEQARKYHWPATLEWLAAHGIH